MPIKFIREFIRLEAASGIVLFGVAVLALIIDNSPFAHYYQTIFNIMFLGKSLLHWINEGLMAFFFLLVGLEIKREMIVGELNSLSKISLPVIAALGGMAIPAIIYVLINWHDSVALRGWAIPTATDIAFALGVLSLLRSRISLPLKIFLMALAIFDDIGAVIIIALFYSGKTSLMFLSFSLLCWLILFLCNRMGVKKLSPYILLGIVLWFCMSKSGVHAAISGVLLAFTIPLQSTNKLEQLLHPWVVFLILPLFGFANAGISFAGITFKTWLNPIPLGIALGLILGKQMGVFGAVWLAVKFKIAKIPKDSDWLSIYGIALICGIGFTMSLFIGSLAFNNFGSDYIRWVRLGVLSGSLISGTLGYLLLRFR